VQWHQNFADLWGKLLWIVFEVIALDSRTARKQADHASFSVGKSRHHLEKEALLLYLHWYDFFVLDAE